MRTATALVIVAVAALGGCGRRHTDAAVASTGQAVTASAPPARRAGLWEQSMARDGVASSFMGRMRFCVDPAREGRLSLMAGAMGRRGCGQHAYVRTAAGYSFEVTCRLPGSGTMVSKGAMTGDLNRAYKVHIETDVSGAALAAMNGRHVTDIAADFLGPCPAGMAPGDIVLGNGMKIDAARLGLGGASAGGGG